MYGKKHSAESKLKMSIIKLGKRFSSEHKNKLSNSKIGNQNRCRQINIYDKNENFIKSFKSIKCASDELGINSGNICKVLKGNYKYSGGYAFKYTKIIKKENFMPKKGTKVIEV